MFTYKKNQCLWSGMHKQNKVKLTNRIFPHIANGELKIIKMVEQWCLQEINSCCLVNFKFQAIYIKMKCYVMQVSHELRRKKSKKYINK